MANVSVSPNLDLFAAWGRALSDPLGNLQRGLGAVWDTVTGHPGGDGRYVINLPGGGTTTNAFEALGQWGQVHGAAVGTVPATGVATVGSFIGGYTSTMATGLQTGFGPVVQGAFDALGGLIGGIESGLGGFLGEKPTQPRGTLPHPGVGAVASGAKEIAQSARSVAKDIGLPHVSLPHPIAGLEEIMAMAIIILVLLLILTR